MNRYKIICFFANPFVWIPIGYAQLDTIGLWTLLKMADDRDVCNVVYLTAYPEYYKLEPTRQLKCALYIQANPNYRSVFLLEALKLLQSEQLKRISKGCKAAIYGDLFNQFSCMNNWVYPYPRMDSIRFSESYLAMDLIATGDTAIFYLKKSLYNRKPIAYLGGLRDGPALPTNAPLEHRDIAYYLIQKILGQSTRLPRNLVQRDANIKKLIQQLNLLDEDTLNLLEAFNSVFKRIQLRSNKHERF